MDMMVSALPVDGPIPSKGCLEALSRIVELAFAAVLGQLVAQGALGDAEQFHRLAPRTADLGQVSRMCWRARS